MRRAVMRLMTAFFCVALSAVVATQARTPSHVILLPMANTSKPSELDFEGGECDIDKTGDTMTCAFQQVLIGPPTKDDPVTCVIDTNRYEQTFQKQDTRRWVSNAGPDGVCGVVVVTTMQQEADDVLVGFWRVTMNTRKIVTNKGVSSLCNVLDETPEMLSWRYASRTLSCKSIKAGSIGQ